MNELTFVRPRDETLDLEFVGRLWLKYIDTSDKNQKIWIIDG